jgi:hypothetical protein
MSEQGERGKPDPEYSPGGIIPASGDDTVIAFISPGEEYFTAEDLRRLRDGSLPERDSGEIPE